MLERSNGCFHHTPRSSCVAARCFVLLMLWDLQGYSAIPRVFIDPFWHRVSVELGKARVEERICQWREPQKHNNEQLALMTQSLFHDSSWCTTPGLRLLENYITVQSCSHPANLRASCLRKSSSRNMQSWRSRGGWVLGAKRACFLRSTTIINEIHKLDYYSPYGMVHRGSQWYTMVYYGILWHVMISYGTLLWYTTSIIYIHLHGVCPAPSPQEAQRARGRASQEYRWISQEGLAGQNAVYMIIGVWSPLKKWTHLNFKVK